jgi:misacylated tRNA(Ala) deacylase
MDGGQMSGGKCRRTPVLQGGEYVSKPISNVIVHGPMHKTEVLYMPDVESNYIKRFNAKVLRVGEGFVVLDRTAFYPLGGGQPSDKGTLSWGDRTVTVKEVKKKGEIVHYLDGPVPSEGDTVTGELDWDYRYAHMRMHTAQHLVSAVVFDLFDSVTVGNQIHGERSRIDFQPGFASDDLQRIEDACNEKLAKGLKVKIYEQDREVLEQRKDMLRISLDLVPKSVRMLRIIEIEGYDVCPCAGTHVRDLNEVGPVKLLKRDSKGKGKVRLTYTLAESR